MRVRQEREAGARRAAGASWQGSSGGTRRTTSVCTLGSGPSATHVAGPLNRGAPSVAEGPCHPPAGFTSASPPPVGAAREAGFGHQASVRGFRSLGYVAI